MTRDEHREQLETFFKGADPTLAGNLDEALYSMSELRLWPDSVDSVSPAQALLCWKIVEKLRAEVFPDDLRM